MHYYASFIKRAFSSLGLDPRNYTSHSFCRGAASFPFNDCTLTKQGCWKKEGGGGGGGLGNKCKENWGGETLKKKYSPSIGGGAGKFFLNIA